MTGPVTITIDGPAVAKGRPRATRAGIQYTPAKTRKYESYVKLCAGQAMNGDAPFSCPVRVEIEAVLPVPQSWSKKKQRGALERTVMPASRPDLDNYIKAALDACNGIVFTDDALICRLEGSKVYGEVPRLTITVQPLTS